jgi:acyl carrier protein
MSNNVIVEGLTQILRDVLEDPDLVIPGDTTAGAEPGWDSMQHIQILIAVEKKFQVKFSLREMDRLRCVGDLAAAIERHTAKI